LTALGLAGIIPPRLVWGNRLGAGEPEREDWGR